MRYGIALAGALLVFAVAGGSAQAATGDKFCLGPQANNCSFATLADCEKAKAGVDNTCTPQSGTTGIKKASVGATNTSK